MRLYANNFCEHFTIYMITLIQVNFANTIQLYYYWQRVELTTQPVAASPLQAC